MVSLSSSREGPLPGNSATAVYILTVAKAGRPGDAERGLCLWPLVPMAQPGSPSGRSPPWLERLGQMT